jgi:Common central domain of tyrosinase
VDAVNRLRNTPGTNGVSIYENFAQSHAGQLPAAHFGAYFLPWHRQMLYEFELALNRVAPRGPTISIPYWDWSAVNTNFKRDFDTWTKMGGAVEGQAIPNPPFQRWTSRILALHDVIRRFTVGGDVPSEEYLTSSETIDTAVNAGDTFAVMADFVESIHNSPHRSIGGDMDNLGYSPNDPIFFSHHAFVDLIWRRWQLVGGQNAFGGTHPGTSNTPATLDQPQLPWGRTVRQILEDMSRCTQYRTGGGLVRQSSSAEYEASGGNVSSSSTSVSGDDVKSTAPTIDGYGSQTKPSNATGKPTVGQGYRYGPARIDGDLGKQPSKFNSVEEKRAAQRKAADTRVQNPRLAKKKLQESHGARDWMVTAMRGFNYNEAQIQLSVASYNKFELERGIDLLATTRNASEADIVLSGETCLSAINAGKAPPRSDDSDIAKY